ncbi:MAG: hypothetical protein ACLTMP_12445 [Eggerthella lenta]
MFTKHSPIDAQPARGRPKSATGSRPIRPNNLRRESRGTHEEAGREHQRLMAALAAGDDASRRRSAPPP